MTMCAVNCQPEKNSTMPIAATIVPSRTRRRSRVSRRARSVIPAEATTTRPHQISMRIRALSAAWVSRPLAERPDRPM